MMDNKMIFKGWKMKGSACSVLALGLGLLIGCGVSEDSEQRTEDRGQRTGVGSPQKSEQPKGAEAQRSTGAKNQSAMPSVGCGETFSREKVKKAKKNSSQPSVSVLTTKDSKTQRLTGAKNQSKIGNHQSAMPTPPSLIELPTPPPRPELPFGER